MGRKQKSGIDYFYFDCDFFDNRKVRKIMKGCGVQSVAILSCLLCNIYKQGYYTLWEMDESTFDIADKIGVSDGAVGELVKKAIEADFFSKKLYEKYGILTSEAVQEIYFEACKRRDVIKYDQRFLLISINDYKNAINVNINPVNDSGGTQSKEEEIKVDERKEGSGASAPPPKSFKKFTEDDFKEDIRKANEDLKLPGKMLHHFFRHWSEKSASGLMNFQLKKTWETKRRLETWRENQPKFDNDGNKHSGSHQKGVPQPAGINETGFGKL